ncbi:flagellar basal-body rod protein FlgB [Shimia isoporae]|uniref:Flagellar basal-body rod protein FlgB n=2 Tax=Shimia isoporae TaxID=647720 RepID=A0A4R1NCR3_9RHOB|nr:flagellar basal-body rod protein FlgB [Shimia isoporae]
MASHAASRQAVVAENMANADTPNYRARDITPFKEIYRSEAGNTAMRVTREGHLGGALEARDASAFESAYEVSPNGNSVTLEEEMLKSVEVKRQHDRALAVYKHSLGVIRTSLGR